MRTAGSTATPAEFEAALTEATDRGVFVTDTGFDPKVQDALLYLAGEYPFATDSLIESVRTVFEASSLT